MNIVVSNFNDQWASVYVEEAEKIKLILSNELTAIHHIGSTSVENLKAKPIIDIMLVIRDIEAIDKYNIQFEELGYECMGEFGISGRRYFRKGGDNRTHQIHAFQEDDKHNIVRHLAVRDYLRTHPEIVIAYGDLKAKLAFDYPKSIDDYCDGKEDFMRELEKEALLWYKQ